MSILVLSLPARLADVDALRGFALFGILVVNIGAFASTYYGMGMTDPAFSSGPDLAVNWLITLFFETKFYLLFSFLFGYSFTLQMDSAERVGAAFIPRILRRQVGLALIGIAHAVLLYHGDILVTYGVLGLLLLTLRGMSERRAVTVAAGLILLTALAWAAIGVLIIRYGDGNDPAGMEAEAIRAATAYRESIGGVIGQHLRELSTAWFVLAFLQAPCALAMFLLGLVAGRRRILADLGAHRPLLKRMAAVGLPVGLAGAVVYASSSMFLDDPGDSMFGLAFGLLTAPLLTGAYIAVALLASSTRPGRAVVAALAPAGRMSLSNYLLQSLLCSLIFTAYGLGLVGRLAPLPVFLIAAGIFAAQLAISAWWLRHHAYGPIEWLLRALTVGSFPAWKPAPDRGDMARGW